MIWVWALVMFSVSMALLTLCLAVISKRADERMDEFFGELRRRNQS